MKTLGCLLIGMFCLWIYADWPAEIVEAREPIWIEITDSKILFKGLEANRIFIRIPGEVKVGFSAAGGYCNKIGSMCIPLKKH